MNTNLELISLDDDELLGVVGGGCHNPCSPPPCRPAPCSPPPCGGGGGLLVDVNVNVAVGIW
ncbi:MAG: hypothetical protein WAK82_21605 [Streptosporangiaceae bacterium]